MFHKWTVCAHSQPDKVSCSFNQCEHQILWTSNNEVEALLPSENNWENWDKTMMGGRHIYLRT